MKILMVADYSYIKWQGKFYSNSNEWNSNNWQSLYDDQIEKIYIVAYSTAKKEINNLKEADPLFEVISLGEKSNNPFHLMKLIISSRSKIKKCINESDIIFYKMFSFNSIIINILFRPKNKIEVAQLVGDPENSFIVRSDIIENKVLRKIISKCIYKISRYVFNNVDIKSAVSEKLRNKYGKKGYKVIVADESRLHEWMYYGDRRTAINVANILFVGRLIEGKGILDLLEAINRIKERGYKLHIVGDGYLRNTVENYIVEHRLSECVTLCGWLEPESRDLIDLYRNCELFVLPSYSEGMPISVLEAMASKCAVITTNVGGIPELINNAINGLLIHPGDIDQIADAILRMSDDLELRKINVENAYETALTHSFLISRSKLSIEIMAHYYKLRESKNGKSIG